MRSQLSLLLPLLIVGPHVASAQYFDDAGVCSRLLQLSPNQTGLYLAYSASAAPNAGATCEPGASFCYTRLNGHSVAFRPLTRLYFLPGHSWATPTEGVWHIRTQTQAANLSGADYAFVYRANVRTRCSPNGLDAFYGNDRYVDLNRYQDHHREPNDSLRRDTGLHLYFHFQIQDPPGGPGCVATDDERAFGNLRALYGFDGVTRTEQKVASIFSFVRSAQAKDVATKDAGLSSEFAYYDGVGPVCFGFAGPQPTVTGQFDAANWQPQQTRIVIKRLEGRNVSEAAKTTVHWSQ